MELPGEEEQEVSRRKQHPPSPACSSSSRRSGPLPGRRPPSELSPDLRGWPSGPGHPSLPAQVTLVTPAWSPLHTPHFADLSYSRSPGFCEPRRAAAWYKLRALNPEPHGPGLCPCSAVSWPRGFEQVTSPPEPQWPSSGKWGSGCGETGHGCRPSLFHPPAEPRPRGGGGEGRAGPPREPVLPPNLAHLHRGHHCPFRAPETSHLCHTRCTQPTGQGCLQNTPTSAVPTRCPIPLEAPHRPLPHSACPAENQVLCISTAHRIRSS